ncbi:MAG: FHA domain-containing protein [Hyphomicrobium sp.]
MAASAGSPRAGGFLGSLKDALAAASRDDTGRNEAGRNEAQKPEAAIKALEGPAVVAKTEAEPVTQARKELMSPSAAEAAREVRGSAGPDGRHVEIDAPPTTRVLRGSGKASERASEAAPRTTLVRGRMQVKRGTFEQDPVVGWLVVVGGPGIGQFRPIFEGNNTMGRSAQNRIAIDFGDDAISSEEQAYIRYDSAERSFLFVPNLAKTNIVSINEKRPTGAVELQQMDVITMGRTQLVFVPFCGADFDWSALSEQTKD